MQYLSPLLCWLAESCRTRRAVARTWKTIAKPGVLPNRVSLATLGLAYDILKYDDDISVCAVVSVSHDVSRTSSQSASQLAIRNNSQPAARPLKRTGLCVLSF